LKALGTKRFKVKCDEPLSDFAFEFNLRRYNLVFEYYGMSHRAHAKSLKQRVTDMLDGRG